MTEPNPQDPHALANELVNAGATPVPDNADETLARLKELEAKYETLATSHGVVTDPVGHARKNLVDHLRAHAAANPNHAADLNTIADAADDAATNPELVSVLIDDALARLRHLDLNYVAQLGRDYRKALASK